MYDEITPFSSEYFRSITCIDKAALRPIYSVMYDKKGKQHKELTVEQLKIVGEVLFAQTLAALAGGNHAALPAIALKNRDTSAVHPRFYVRTGGSARYADVRHG